MALYHVGDTVSYINFRNNTTDTEGVIVSIDYEAQGVDEESQYTAVRVGAFASEGRDVITDTVITGVIFTGFARSSTSTTTEQNEVAEVFAVGTSPFATIEVQQDASIQQTIDDHEGRPIIPVEDITRVREGHYLPLPGSGESLVEFGIGDDSSYRLRPHLVETITDGRLVGREYKFRDRLGAVWLNQHQVNMTNVLPHSTFRDRSNQSWMARNTYNRLVNGVLKPKPKKKLRRKHPIPEIKDEKYYAGKEFIA